MLFGVARGAVVGLVLALAVVPGWTLFRGAAPYVLPPLIGVVLGLEADSYAETLAGSAVYSGVLAAFAGGWLSLSAVVSQVNSVLTDKAAIAQHFLAVIPQSLFGAWVPLLRSSDSAKLGIAGTLLVALVLSAAASCAVLALRRAGVLAPLAPLAKRFRLGTAEQFLASVLMVLVLVWLVVSLGAMGSQVGTDADTYLQKGGYATDYGVYLRTIQDMARGTGYYDALRNAANDDARAARADHYNLPKASWVRMPVLPWFLATVFGRKLSLAVTFAFVLAAVGAGLVGWSLDRRAFAGAGVVAALVVVPYFGFVGTWIAAFLADYWGGILVLIAFGFLLNRLTYAGIVTSLLAALTREQIWFWLFAVVVACVWLWFARKRWAPVAAAGGAFVVAVAAYEYHWYVVNTRYASILSGIAAGSGPMGLAFGWSGLGAAVTRVDSVADFVTTSYTMYRYPAGLLVVAALAFFSWRVVSAWRAGETAVAELAALGFLGVMTVLLLSVTYMSQYWGALFMPLALAGVAGLLCEFVRLAARIDTPAAR